MAIRFYVAHGASGSSASMRGHVEGLAKRGIEAVAIDLPVKTAEDVVPRFRQIVPDKPEPGGPVIAVGGQSYGGRVSTLAAAAEGTDYEGIVCFSYPLHPPGKPDQAQARSSHWPRPTRSPGSSCFAPRCRCCGTASSTHTRSWAIR
jgi:predicted alpha/beta-hydrolase family hydrolase